MLLLSALSLAYSPTALILVLILDFGHKNTPDLISNSKEDTHQSDICKSAAFNLDEIN